MEGFEKKGKHAKRGGRPRGTLSAKPGGATWLARKVMAQDKPVVWTKVPFNIDTGRLAESSNIFNAIKHDKLPLEYISYKDRILWIRLDLVEELPF